MADMAVAGARALSAQGNFQGHKRCCLFWLQNQPLSE